MNPLVIAAGLGALGLGALAFKKKPENKGEALAQKQGGGGVNLPSSGGTSSASKPAVRIPEIVTPKGKTSFPPGAELAIITASPGLMTRKDPSPTAEAIAPQGMAPNDAFFGTTIAVIQRGFPEKGAPAGSVMEWWRIMTPSGGIGYARAVGPNGEKNARLTGEKIPGSASPAIPVPSVPSGPQVVIEPPQELKYPPAPSVNPLPDPPLPQDLANLIKPVNLDTTILPMTLEKGVVKSSNGMNVRTGPATTFGLVAKNDAWAGTTVTILEKGLGKVAGSKAEWWKVITPGGSTGYTQAIDSTGKMLIEPISSAVSA